MKQNLITEEQIFNELKKAIVETLRVDEESIKPESSLINDLGADSLDTVELIMEFEKEFNITIPDNEAEKISTVGEVIKAIEYLKNNKQDLKSAKGAKLYKTPLADTYIIRRFGLVG